MHLKEWALAVAYSFNPMYYKKVADAPPKEMFALVNKTITRAFVVMLIVALPMLVAVPSYVSSALGSFDVLTIDGRTELGEQIGVPAHDPHLVIDLSAQKAYEGERALLTREYFYFQSPFGAKKINTDYVLDPLAHKRESSLIVFGLFLLWLPSLLIYAYIVTFLKYLIWWAVFSTMAIVAIRALVLSSMRLRRIVNICAYALLPIVILEVLTIPFDTAWLFPILDFMGFAINLGSILLYMVLLIIGLVGLEKEIRLEIRDRGRY
ncbi:hypothetical protein HY641_01645 [Candidatus Woesearchaeota archaeon]|nr:hypothetical protein [Candidatus Woesearchaeota archaeon]